MRLSEADLRPLQEQLRRELELRSRGRRTPYRLGVLLESGNVAGASFARSLEREARMVGIEVVHELVPADQPELTLERLDALAVDPRVTGVVVMQPISSLPQGMVAAHLPASKDVEAITPAALAGAAVGSRRGTPVAEACLATLRFLGVDPIGARILLVGHGATGGRPIAQRLLAAGAQLTVIQSDIESFAEPPEYDILISAVGIAGIVPERVVRQGCIALDVGTAMVGSQLRGDLGPGAASRARLATPVPGGVGRVTSACALLSLTELASQRPGPVASWSLLETVARLISPRDAVGGAAAAAVTGALAAGLDGLCRMHQSPDSIGDSGRTAVRMLLAADRDRLAFRDFQRAQRRSDPEEVRQAKARAAATPSEIAALLQLLERRLEELTTTPSLDLDRELALALAAAAREAVQRLGEEFSRQS